VNRAIIKCTVTVNLIKAEGKKAEKRDVYEGLSTSAGKKNFLMAIAEALGQAIDQQMNRMAKLAEDIKQQTTDNQSYIDGMDKKGNAKESSQATLNSQKLGSLQSELQAVSQQMSILSNVVATTLKSIGEAQTTMARKG
jgi:predicted  nucleic acid-binding Zn-ribbon protein